ncbi:MAG TPA: sulfurtransferase complex subunit TusB [Methanotrichaceae archaeon]|nr:sulfurtransferase complex subunit TusB [Methanotrichaceae archaeon]
MGSKSTCVFLLTKSPQSPRSELCLKLLARSKKARLYLVGDGVYHLLNQASLLPPSCDIYACKEDVAARGIVARKNVEILGDFYERLVEDVMEGEDRLFAF